MKLYRPKSFLILLLAGFTFVALPLLAALAGSVYFMDKMAVQSTQSIFCSANAARESRSLLEQLVEQERQARLFNIFPEAEHLLAIRKNHEKIREILASLTTFPFGEEVKGKLEKLQTEENHLFVIFSETDVNNQRKAAVERYRDLNVLAHELQEASYQLMFQVTEKLQKTMFNSQKMMLWLTCILFVVSLLLISLFAYLLIRPIRQIDKGILRLGEGDFVTPISVSGPQDLEFLGTKLDWLRERLAELEKEKNKFVAHISHELKTPLASIREGTGLLAEEVVGPLTAQQKEVVKILSNNTRLLQKLIENIVSFNMAQARPGPPRKQPFALDQLIAEVVEDHKPVVIAGNLHLSLNLAPVAVNGDQDQIRAVIDNILSNAIKHSPQYGEISLTLQTEAGRAVIDLKDGGPGIPEEEKAQIFKPFFQGQSGLKGKVKGTGLGLAIAKEYMANHHGTIEVMSDQNDGAHFRLTLPIEEIS